MYEIEDIKTMVAPIAKDFGVKKIAIFGSYARGEQTENSDIDFVIDKGRLTGFAYFGFLENLQEVLKTRIDLLTYESMANSLIKNARKDEVVIYEG